MKNIVLFLVLLFTFVCNESPVWATDELYILNTKDGSAIVVKGYRFSGKYIEFTTENNLPGFIKRAELVRIDNMVGVPIGEVNSPEEEEIAKDSVATSWTFSAVTLTALVVLMVYLLRRKQSAHARKEKEQKTAGHLSFEYREAFGSTSQWTIAVQSAFEEKGILYIEGICTTTDKQKKFMADRVVGPVTDKSNDRQAPMAHFFADAHEKKQ